MEKVFVHTQNEVAGLVALYRKQGLKVEITQINDHLWVIKTDKNSTGLFIA